MSLLLPRRAILHSDSTYSSLRQRSATGRRLLLAQCFTRLVVGRRRATSIAIPRKSRVILYDRAANLSVLIRNSTVQEMNPTPIFFFFFFFYTFRCPFPFPITFNAIMQLYLSLLCLLRHYSYSLENLHFWLRDIFLSFFFSHFQLCIATLFQFYCLNSQ